MPAFDSSGRTLARQVAQRLFKKYVKPLREAGGRIPTNRALAVEFDVNIGTITKALSFLISDGFIRTVVGSGTYVLPREVRKSRFGIYYNASITGDRPEDRAHLTLVHEFHRHAALANAEVRDYVETNTVIGTEFVLPAALVEDVRRGALDGLFATNILADDRSSFLELEVPTVGGAVPLSHGGIYLDRRAYMTRAVDKLVQRGARRLALIPSHHFQESHLDPYLGDYQGFLDALDEQGLPFHSEWLAEVPTFQSDLFEHGKTAFRQLWNARSERPEGIIVGTDVFALGLLEAAREDGVRLPGEALVVVAENRENVWPELAQFLRFQFSISDMAECAVRMLSAGADAAPATLSIAPRFVGS